MKTILVAGRNGLIGSQIFQKTKGYRLLGIERKDFQLKDRDFVKKYEEADIIMNFTGAPIIKRWTPGNRREILNSRLMSARKLGKILKMGTKKPRHYLGASAIGIYSDTGRHTEDSFMVGEGFMKDVVEKWEEETIKLEGEKTLVSVLRFGVVLSRDGGMLKKLLPFYKSGLGGKIGSGRQAFSWIHMDDLTGAVNHIIQNKGKGIYNIVSPGACTNSDFSRSLGKAVNKPAYFTVPRTALKIWYGQAAGLITEGQEVFPERLLREGFVFRYPNLSEALEDIVN